MSDAAVLDRTFDALANEHRRDVVRRLANGPIATPELAAHYGMSKQALSRHLRLLEEAQLIERRLDGRVHHVQLVPDSLSELVSWASTIRHAWESSLDRLDSVLGEPGVRSEAVSGDGATGDQSEGVEDD